MTQLLMKLFLKEPHDPQKPAFRSACGKLAGIVGIACNVLLFLLKLLAGLLSGSVSVMADAINNLSDASSSLVTLLGFKLAEKPADDDHPYGHARIEYLSGLIVAAMILFIGIELVKTSISKILHPEATAFTWLTIAILLASIGVKLWLSGFCRKLGKTIQSAALEATAADSRNDVISTLAVLIAGILSMIWGWKIDGYVGLAVAAFILYSGIGIVKETIDPILGAAPDPELTRMIRDVVLSHEQIYGIHDLIVHDYGPGRRFASVHVEMDSREDPLISHDLIDDIEREFRIKHNIQLVIHYDPLVMDNEDLYQARQMIESIIKHIDERLSVHDFRMVRGPGHTNLIFDLVLPHDLDSKQSELKSMIDQELQKQNEQYYAVITFDSEAFN